MRVNNNKLSKLFAAGCVVAALWIVMFSHHYIPKQASYYPMYHCQAADYLFKKSNVLMTSYDVSTSGHKPFTFFEHGTNYFPFNEGVERQIHTIFVQLLQGCRDNVECHVLDIGMNAGYFTALSASMGSSVIAIEPQEACHYVSRMTSKINNWCDRVSTVVAGAWHEKIFINVAVGECNTGFVIQKNSQVKSVETVVVDELLEARGWKDKSIEVVKIDTEGAEVGVLKGMANAFEGQHVKNLIIELAPHVWSGLGLSIEEGKALFNSIENSGYRFILLEDPTSYSSEINSWKHLQLHGISGEMIEIPPGNIGKVIDDRLSKRSGTNLWLQLVN